MAQKVRVEIVDDIDGRVAVQTVRFSLDGVGDEIDLSEENAEALRAELAPYVAAGQRVGGRKVRSVAAAARARPRRVLTPAERSRNREIRLWARAEGIPVSRHGLIADTVIKQYESRAAKPKQARTKQARGAARSGVRRRSRSR
uniref:histone-like nucleoid-structuring protein Lsr2 n=1 Tax=Amycolatopsis sp. CA-096443 TaxID=3239919 RepID=UPI003F49A27D